jgi:hypothetical protein
MNGVSLMKKMDIIATDVVSIVSAFENLITLTNYNLTKNDVSLIEKSIGLVEDNKRPLIASGYPALFSALKNL